MKIAVPRPPKWTVKSPARPFRKLGVLWVLAVFSACGGDEGGEPPAGRHLASVTQVSAGAEYSLALLADGTVWGWGANFYPVLGIPTVTQSDRPVTVGALTGITAISAGYEHALALHTDGTVFAWGHNNVGQLGDNTTVESQQSRPS